jgi:polar amino acid transport system permease protein
VGAAVRFDYALILSKLPDILSALGVTIGVWIASLIGAIAIGFAVAVGRRFGPRPLNAVLLGYVELFRGTPFLVQLFLLYFGGPYAGISLDALPAGLLALSVYGGAYFSEVFRAGFEAVPRGHVEAAECVGFSRTQIIGRILLPEMAVLVLPAGLNTAISLLKDTAVLSVITVPELTLTVSAIGTEFYAFVEALFLLALGYWGLVEISAALGRVAERRLARFRFSA